MAFAIDPGELLSHPTPAGVVNSTPRDWESPAEKKDAEAGDMEEVTLVGEVCSVSLVRTKGGWRTVS